MLEAKDELLKKTAEESEPASPSEIQTLNEKLEKSQQKYFEALNQNTQLKNELKIAHKCIQQEVGENVNYTQILAGNSNWRGRAQQIAMLQSKIVELRDRFDTSSLESSFEDDRLPMNLKIASLSWKKASARSPPSRRATRISQTTPTTTS